MIKTYKYFLVGISTLALQCTMANPKLEYSLNRKTSLDESILQINADNWKLSGKPLSPFEISKKFNNPKRKFLKEECQIPPALYVKVSLTTISSIDISNSEFYFQDEDGKKYPALSRNSFKDRFPSPSYAMLRNNLDFEFKSVAPGKKRSINCEKTCNLEANTSFENLYAFLLPLLPARKVLFFAPGNISQELEIKSKRKEPIEIEF